MKLVVGLGNPGRKYQATRHNIGFAILAELGLRFGVSKPRHKFHGEVLEATIGAERALLLSPLTYMNLSGLSVAEAKAFYKIPPEDMLVLCDDLNLPLGKLRIREQGSAGGQKGLDDIIRKLGTENFPRLRVGIGSPPEGCEWSDFVLSTFTQDEKPQIKQSIDRAVEAVSIWANDGIEESMNRYN
ncbi:MAG: aminoacyl-tRNA hydrolase [Thermoguttaceae bacterium]